MFAPPGEVTMINHSGHVFRAHPTGVFHPRQKSFQYRLQIPGVKLSLIVVTLTEAQLNSYLRTLTPILIVPNAA